MVDSLRELLADLSATARTWRVFLHRRTRSRHVMSLLLAPVLLFAVVPLVNGGTAGAATKNVNVWLLRPSDVPEEARYANGIADVMHEAQRFYKAELGVTFSLNSPVVRVVEGEHTRSWYETEKQANDDPYFRVTFHMHDELERRFHPDPSTVNVGLIIAENPGAGGSGGNGWVSLSGHDADGAAGVGGDMPRWYGGMIHELGHAFGLPDSSGADGTPMSGDGVYKYGPDIHFTQAQKDGILQGRYASILS